MSAMAQPSVTGITAQAINAKIIVSIGAITNKTRFAPVGMICSFMNIFNASAKAWSMPQNPTTLGPLRICMAPSTLRSATVK